MNKNIQTFIACESSFEDARAVIFGAPFDSICQTMCRIF